jgi:UDP-N-acetylmuramyl pentapeptide phosphotransferase/UDP-N-acetylglucosamine-1-phosphate transferase
MQHLILAILCFASMLIYIRIGAKYNIVDKPNARSSHSELTIRGGGIIFPISCILYVLVFHQISPFLVVGLLAICIISFLDDISELGIRSRIAVHLLAVTSLVFALHGFENWHLLFIPIFYVLVIGCINAYNFMDGVNGITGLYSLILFGSLLYLNQTYTFTDSNFIMTGILSCLVFLYFNFRKKAKCFAGDVGSVGVAFWIISLIALAVVKTGDFKYVLFLSVYGVDTVLTILHRLYLRQNILEAHRLHFYQILANDQCIPHLWVAGLYAFLQLLVNAWIIYSNWNFPMLFLVTIVPLCLVYILFKHKLMDKSR